MIEIVLLVVLYIGRVQGKHFPTGFHEGQIWTLGRILLFR